MYIKNDPYASYKLLRTEFEKRNYVVTEEVINNSRIVTYTSSSGQAWKTMAAHLSYPFVSQKIRTISINKEQAYDFVQKMGLSVPYTKIISKGHDLASDEATRLIGRYGKLIVKPSSSSLARGLTLGVTSNAALMDAVALARTISPTVLVQEQVEGEEVRFAVVDGKVVSALVRRTPRVVGDGVATVAELIVRENDARSKLKIAHISYPILSGLIIDSSMLTNDRVLGRGELLELSRATMIRNGCSVYDVLREVHPTYIQSVEKLARGLEADFIAVDIFLKDYTVEQTDHNYWFIEFNSSPVLKLFYGCRDGKMYDIVPLLVTTIDRYLHRPIKESILT